MFFSSQSRDENPRDAIEANKAASFFLVLTLLVRQPKVLVAYHSMVLTFYQQMLHDRRIHCATSLCIFSSSMSWCRSLRSGSSNRH